MPDVITAVRRPRDQSPRGAAVIEMALHDAEFGESAVASIVIAERRAWSQLREAEAAGVEYQVIDELTRAWRDLLSTLLRVYAAPGNWRRGLPLGAIPQDTAEALSEHMACLVTDPKENATSQALLLPLDDLLPALATAREEFHRERSADDGGRKGVGGALTAVLGSLGAGRQDMREMLEPLYYLAATLDDLDKGRRDPIHAPRRSKKGGAPPAPSQWWFLKERVAVAVSMLLDDTERFHPGWGPREDAANECVARRLNRIGLTCDSITVGNWRSDVMAHLLPGDPGVDRPDNLTGCNEHVRTYLHVWYEWQDKKADIPAETWVEGLIGDNLRPIVAHPPKKVG